MSEKKLIEAINLAYELLNPEVEPQHPSSFLLNKNIIKELFTDDFKLSKRSNIVLTRLSVIDSFYSTNMNKNPGGLRILSEKISEIKDEDFHVQALEYLSDGKSNFFKKIFVEPHGRKCAPSLVSKYAYYATKFEFPIYDSLVKETFSKIKNKDVSNIGFKPSDDKYRFINKYRKLMETNFFKVINENKIDKLDSFGWLAGQLNKAKPNLNLLKGLNTTKFSKRIKDKEILK